MKVYDMLREAIEFVNEENPELNFLPDYIYLDNDIFVQLRSEVVIRGTNTSVPESINSLSFEFFGAEVNVRPDNWEYSTVH